MKKNEIKNSARCLLQAYNEHKIEIDIEKIYFELQQSVEKVLKAILTKNVIVFPKTHDIEQLLNIFDENNITLLDNKELVNELIELSDYAVEGRYSVLHDDVNNSEKYCQIIEQIIKVALDA